MNVTSCRAWSQARTGETSMPTFRHERWGFSFSGCLTIFSMRRANGLTNGKSSTPRAHAKSVSVTAMGAIMWV